MTFNLLSLVTTQYHYSPMLPFFYVILALIISSLMVSARLLFQRKTPNHRLPTPPGSTGLPYIGETYKLYNGEDPDSFFSSRKKRYGDVFMTNILGCSSAMVSSPEAIRTVLVGESDLFKPTYPPSKEKLIGPEAVFFQPSGPYHSTLKRFIQASFLPAAIKSSVPHIEQILLSLLPTWTDAGVINTLKEMKRYAFEVAVISAFGHNKELKMERIKDLYLRLEKGYNSFPLHFPGSLYKKSLQAREALNETISQLLHTRNESKSSGGGLLGTLLEARQNLRCDLTDSQIADNLIGVIFAAHDTTASLLTWILKYLHDHPQVLQDVTLEQEGIRRKIVEENRTGLTWEDTRQMPFATRVIQETLRCATIISFTFREAVKDVELEGHSIPKGWKVLPLFRNIHHNHDFFPQPLKFDPSRFEVPPKANTFMPFGIGSHSCPGSEMAKLEVFILLHYLTISCRWEIVGDDCNGVHYLPFPVPKHGLPIKIWLRNKVITSPNVASET